jgi:predicted dienelactone hydrolase
MGISLLLGGCGGAVAPEQPPDVAARELVWVDQTRGTPRTAGYAGAPQRTLRVVIWQPDTGMRLPLLLMAHGFGGLPEKFDAFARTVAGAGFIVAAPAFPLTNQQAPGGHQAGFSDFRNQPADLRFVLTQLLDASGTAGSGLTNRIDGHQIAVLGHSMGGATVLGVTRKHCCLDPRVRAAIIVAAPLLLANAFGPDSTMTGPPTLILHGTDDQSVGYSDAGTLYEVLRAPRILVGLPGAGHSEALESQVAPPIEARARAQLATIAFLRAYLQDQRAALESALMELANDGVIVRSDLDAGH